MPAIETQPAPTAASRLLADFIAALTHDGLAAVTDGKSVQTRLCGLGFSVECSRCGGCGSYGPLSVEGARCFGCGGRGKVAPGLSRALLARVRAEVTTEVLDAYVVTCKARAVAKRAAKGSGERVMRAYATTLFMRHFYGAPREEGGAGRLPRGEERAFSPLAYAIHDGEDAAVAAHRDLEFAAKRGEPGATADAVLAAEAAVVRARRVQDIAFAAALASGEVEASAVESVKVSAMRDDPATAGWLVQIHETGFRTRTFDRARELLAAAAVEVDAMAPAGS